MTGSNASGSPPPDSGPKPEEQSNAKKTMNVKIKDQQENETFFKIKTTTKLIKVFNAFTKAKSIDPQTVRFYFHGSRIQDDETPEQLEMEDGAEIQTMIEQLGGAGTPVPDAPADDAPEEGEGAPTHLNVKVVDQSQNEIFFKIKMITPLKKVMDAYCQRQGIARDAVRFLIESERIVDTDTPASKEMVDGDIIEVFREQLGGGGEDGPAGERGEANAPANGEGAKTHITITVKDDHGYEMGFKVKPTTSMEKLMDAYCGQQGRAPGSLRFFTPDGKRINKTDTPTTLELEDGDLIDAHEEQHGGSTEKQANKVVQFVGTPPPPKSIILTVKSTFTFPDTNSLLIKYGCKQLMALLMDNCCIRFCRHRNSVSFVVNDRVITDFDTAESLGLTDNAVITVYEADALPWPSEDHSSTKAQAGSPPRTDLLSDDEDYAEKIQIKVQSCRRGDYASFNVLPSSEWKALMHVYCRHVGEPLGEVSFWTTDRCRIYSHEKVQDYDLKDGETIMAYELSNNLTKIPKPDTYPRKIVTFSVKDCFGKEVFFKMKRVEAMKRLMEYYTKKMDLLYGSFEPIKFFTVDGKPISPTDTPITLKLDDSDMILSTFSHMAKLEYAFQKAMTVSATVA